MMTDGRGGRRTKARITARERPLPTNRMTGFLMDFCRERLLDEKVFVVPSYSIGHQIGAGLARAGGSWINLRFLTLPTLALEFLGEDPAATGMKQVGDTELLIIVDRLFRELREGGRLGYFQRLRPTPGVAKALCRTILKLRLAKITAKKLDAGAFRVASKGRDLALLLSEYEKLLERGNVLDGPALYSRAIDRALKGGTVSQKRPWHLCLRDRSLNRLEEDMVRAVAGDRLVLVPEDPVFGLPRPELLWKADPGADTPPAGEDTDAGRLAWLFDPAAAPPPGGDGSPDLFRAVGPTNECREIVRRILASGVRFDEVEVIHTPGFVYPVTFHLLGERARIPVTLAGGIPVSFTAPGRVFAGLADWVDKDFLVTELTRLIEGGDFVFPSLEKDGNPSYPGPAGHLKKAWIVKGRDRYIPRLEALGRDFETKLRERSAGKDEPLSAEKAADLRRTVGEIARLTEEMNGLLDLFSCVPQQGTGDTLEFRVLCDRFCSALERYARLRSDPDRNALDLILSEIRRTSASGALTGAEERIGLDDALSRLRTAVASLAAGASAPLPGSLHVSEFRSGGFSGRPVTFVAGFQDSDFPGRGRQDPLLLDEESGRISSFLPTAAEGLRRDLHGMALCLSSLRGRVTLSFSSYDIIEERASFPSSLILQAFRLIRGDPKLDYTDLDKGLRDAAGFLPDPSAGIFDEIDWWLGKLLHKDGFLDGRAAVEGHFAALRDGLEAAEARAGKKFSPYEKKLSPYEGIVKIDPKRHDPTVNRALVLSASRLERLAMCPYGYFLRYVLGIEPPEEPEFDPSRWLDPMQRGSLLHEILCEFMRKVTERGEFADAGRHGSLMDETARDVIRRWRARVPPPSEAIFERERRDIMESLGVFFSAEAAREPKVTPLEFERHFEGVAIPLDGERSFFLKGVIDRIDRTGPESFRIVDYKMGNYTSFEGLVRFGRGKVIQHALYALAAERFLGEETGRPARVPESGYYFPTRRGEGREIMVANFDRRDFAGLLGSLLDLVAKGYFIALPGQTCDFCDFLPVCKGAGADPKIRAEDNADIFDAYESLKDYE